MTDYIDIIVCCLVLNIVTCLKKLSGSIGEEARNLTLVLSQSLNNHF